MNSMATLHDGPGRTPLPKVYQMRQDDDTFAERWAKALSVQKFDNSCCARFGQRFMAGGRADEFPDRHILDNPCPENRPSLVHAWRTTRTPRDNAEHLPSFFGVPERPGLRAFFRGYFLEKNAIRED